MKNKEAVFVIFLAILAIVVLIVYIAYKGNSKEEVPTNDASIENNVEEPNVENNVEEPEDINNQNEENQNNEVSQENISNQSVEQEANENRQRDSIKGVNDNVSLEQVSIKGIKIGDKIAENMKNRDATNSFYTYNGINLNVDNDDRINYLSFFVSNTRDINALTDEIRSAEIRYNNNRLENVSDFKAYIGEGEKIEVEEGNGYFLVFLKDGMELRLFTFNENIQSVILRKMQ